MTPDTLEPLESSAAEIAALFARYEVALADASAGGQSVDGCYVDAYTAGFLLAKIVVRASGFRVRGGENHRDTISALPWLMGSAAQSFAYKLDAARKQRNSDLYDAVGMIDGRDVEELLVEVRVFEGLLGAWVTANHAGLVVPRS